MQKGTQLPTPLTDAQEKEKNRFAGEDLPGLREAFQLAEEMEGELG